MISPQRHHNHTHNNTNDNNNNNNDDNNICADDFARKIATLKSLQGNDRPFMVMDIHRVEEMLDEWLKHLPRVQPFYSIDCNSNPVLLRLLAAHPTIVGFNCTTRSSVEQAMEYVEPSQILYSNACWTRSFLQDAKRRDVNLLSFERASELERIALSHPEAELLLKVHIAGRGDDPLTQMGCPLEEAAELMRFAADMEGIKVVGITCHLGGGSTSPSMAIQSIRHLFDIGFSFGLPLSILNVGDGFPPGGNAFHTMATELTAALSTHFPRSIFPHLKVIATPGRFFAQPSLTLITNVVGRQSVDASLVTGDEFDSGCEGFIYQTNDSFYGSFGCRIGGDIGVGNGGWEPECVPLFGDELLSGRLSEHALGMVMGPCIDDVLQSICHFRPLAVGEWLLWRDMGAYTLNNCGTLDDHDHDEEVDDTEPMIFYFTSKATERAFPTQYALKEIICEMEADDDDAGSCGHSASLYTLGGDEIFGCETPAPSDLPADQLESSGCEEGDEGHGIFDWILHQH